MKDIDLKTKLIGIFVFAYILFGISDRIGKNKHMHKKKMHMEEKKKAHIEKWEKESGIGRYVTSGYKNDGILDTKTGVRYKEMSEDGENIGVWELDVDFKQNN